MDSHPDDDLIHSDSDIRDVVDGDLFAQSFDSLESHIQRKQAVADETRYSILYVLHTHTRLSRQQLVNATGMDNNRLQHHLRTLLDTNLLAKIPAPDEADGRRTYYRITTLGRQEIEADIHHIRPDDEDA